MNDTVIFSNIIQIRVMIYRLERNAVSCNTSFKVSYSPASSLHIRVCRCDGYECHFPKCTFTPEWVWLWGTTSHSAMWLIAEALSVISAPIQCQIECMTAMGLVG